MPKIPRLAEVQCSKIQFSPGDRLIVRTTHRLSAEEKRKLIQTIQRWAGVEIEVFIYCILDMEIKYDRRG